jgi:hypothetical protein
MVLLVGCGDSDQRADSPNARPARTAAERLRDTTGLLLPLSASNVKCNTTGFFVLWVATRFDLPADEVAAFLAGEGRLPTADLLHEDPDAVRSMQSLGDMPWLDDDDMSWWQVAALRKPAYADRDTTTTKRDGRRYLETVRVCTDASQTGMRTLYILFSSELALDPQ